MKTSLENLIFNSGLTIGQFADKVGVKKTTLEKQLYTKKGHIKYSFIYGRILGVNSIRGFENNVSFEIIFN